MARSIGKTIGEYLSLIKFSHTVFALPFAFIGFSLAVFKDGYAFQWRLLGLMLLCMVFARSAAMAFNRWLDRKFDALNPRTANREIPAGTIRPNAALGFVVANCLAFVLSAYFINTICFLLAPVALFVVLFYSYTKRFTALCHLVLGLGLSLAPIGAYLTVAGKFAPLPLMFSGLVIGWVAGFDIIYALQDEAFDKSQSLYSIPAELGAKRALRVSRLLHGTSAGIVILAGVLGHFHFLYWIGAALYLSLLAFQHSLVKPNDLSRVNLAFVTTNSFAGIGFAAFTICSMLL